MYSSGTVYAPCSLQHNGIDHLQTLLPSSQTTFHEMWEFCSYPSHQVRSERCQTETVTSEFVYAAHVMTIPLPQHIGSSICVRIQLKLIPNFTTAYNISKTASVQHQHVPATNQPSPCRTNKARASRTRRTHSFLRRFKKRYLSHADYHCLLLRLTVP